MDVMPFARKGRFWRGNLHTHSTRSDGRLPPEAVADFYRNAGYDFLALTDHFWEHCGYPITDTRGLLAPFIGPAILDRERDRARLLRGPAAFLTRRGFRCIVVQYRLSRARSDIQPTIRAAQLGERVAEPRGKKLGVLREPSADDVAARNVGALAAVDFFLLAEFLVEFRWSEFL